ncbi:MAG: recombinase family protein, partial [Candidatus Aminicenantaceae bacterium]
VYCSDIDDMMLLLQDIKGAIARAEIRKLKKRTHGSIRRKLEAGEYCGQAPLGYRNIPKTKSYPAHYVQTDDAPKVKEFLEMFSTGKYTAPEMVEIAKQMGLKSKRGNELNLDAVKYILKNPTGFYYGEWTYMGYRGKYQGLWEPIVDKKVILRNRALLKQQTSKYQKVSGKDWKFKGLIECSWCGRILLGELGSWDYKKKDGTLVSGKKVYYHCNRSPYKDKKTNEMKKCGAPWMLEDIVEEEMLRNISLLEFDKKAWDEMKKHLFDTQTKDFILKELRAFRTEYTQNETIIDKLLRDEIDTENEAKKKSIRKRRDKYENRQVVLEEKLVDLEVEEEMWNENVEKMIDVVDSLKDFEKKFKKTNDKSRKLMIKLMTNKIIANFYKGDLPKKVLPQHNRMQLHFVWCDEFQTLFDVGIVKKAEEWDKTHKQKYTLPKTKKTKLSSKQQSLDFLLSIN